MKSLWDLLYPPRCPFCRKGLEEERICPECQESLPWLVGPRAERRVDHVVLCDSALSYEGLARRCIHRYKFHRRRGYARILGPLTAQCAHDHLSNVDFDLVSWPPLSAKRLRERGFDQARLLAQAVAEDRGMEETPLFVKANTARRQSSIQSAAGRRANVLGAFSLVDPRRVRGKKILLVDDVVTTGATLSECARVLRTAGAEGVWAVTLAGVQSRK